MCNSQQKVFPFYLICRLIFAHVVCIYDQCIYCSNVDHAIKHCHCPSASYSLCCVPCKHLIQRVYCTFCFVINFNVFRLSWIAADCWIMMEWWKEDTGLFFFGTYDKIVRSLANPRIDEFSSRFSFIFYLYLFIFYLFLFFFASLSQKVSFFCFFVFDDLQGQQHKEIICC